MDPRIARSQAAVVRAALLTPAVLPEGVVELGAGNRIEDTFFTGPTEVPLATTSWADDGDRLMWARIVPLDPTALVASRFGNAAVEDVTIQGSPGYVATGLPGGPADGVTTVAWSDGERTIFLFGKRVTMQELLDTAESMESVSEEDWSAAGASARPASPEPSPPSASIATTTTFTD